MNCPHCDGKLHVYETRQVEGTVYRRRHCAPCNDTFVTEEHFSEHAAIPATRPRGRPRKTAIASTAHNPFGLGATHASS